MDKIRIVRNKPQGFRPTNCQVTIPQGSRPDRTKLSAADIGSGADGDVCRPQNDLDLKSGFSAYALEPDLQ